MHMVSAWGEASQPFRLHVWRLVCRPKFLTRTPEFTRPHRRSSDRFAQEATATSPPPPTRKWIVLHRMRPGGKISRKQCASVDQYRDYGATAQLLQASSGCNGHNARANATLEHRDRATGAEMGQRCLPT